MELEAHYVLIRTSNPSFTATRSVAAPITCLPDSSMLAGMDRDNRRRTMDLYELARRSNDGLIVRLLWDKAQDRIIIRYRDPVADDVFAAVVPNAEAMTAFHHPNAYRSAPVSC
jgi:hypothetical protein